MTTTVCDEGAATYEQHWAPALHRHARELVAAVPPEPSGAGRTVADVATGTGTLLPLLHEFAGRGVRVIALDRSRGMLERVAPFTSPSGATPSPWPCGVLPGADHRAWSVTRPHLYEMSVSLRW